MHIWHLILFWSYSNNTVFVKVKLPYGKRNKVFVAMVR